MRGTNWRLRICKFSLVGALGIGVQLTVLSVLVNVHMNYLFATLLAVESAIVHNFLWHERFTWCDRGEHNRWERCGRFFRFHLSNGLISQVGNLLFMRLLAGAFHLPILAANALAIALCFAANFTVSDRWVFLSGRSNLVSKLPVTGPDLALPDRASIPTCAPRREHRARLPLLPVRVRARSAELAKTAPAPTAHPISRLAEICAGIFG